MTGSEALNIQTSDVLKFWHMVEYFVPFDLDEVTASANARYSILDDDLLHDHGNQKLPWASTKALLQAKGNPQYNHQFNLYLIPFKKAELTKISQQVFPRDKKHHPKIEFEERLSDKGETCFAKIAVSDNGVVDLKQLTLSTLPWALGKLLSSDFASLNSDGYQREERKLQAKLAELTRDSEQEQDDKLTASTLTELINILKEWASFFPQHPISIIVETIKLRKKTSNSYNNSETQQEVFDRFPILNSFYIEDLEKIVNGISQKVNPILDAYVFGAPDESRKDLYLKENHALITDKLKPQLQNSGRWPADAKHMMSLMQQFAINECFYPSNQVNLFSVNGPPGTGKTTLLQDVISENIIRRAKVLATYNDVSETFKGTLRVGFSNNESKNISLLQDELAGFEMLVASSNNAAVENISRELPLKQKIALEYHEDCAYLAPVAHKLFAYHKSNQVIPAKTANEPWGMISIALGNAKNRNQFLSKAFFKPDDGETTQKRLAEGKCLTIWEWHKQYQGPSFKQAKKAFNQILISINESKENLKHCSDIFDRLTKSDDLISALDEIDKMTSIQHELQKQTEFIENELVTIKNTKERTESDIKRLRSVKPSIFAFILRKPESTEYKSGIKLLRRELIVHINKERELQEDLTRLTTEMASIEKNIQVLQKKAHAMRQAQNKLKKDYEKLITKLPGIKLPPLDGNLENHSVQLAAFWQSEMINQLKSQLFIAALQLHEAWLAESLNKKLFTSNLIAISYLLSNKKTIDKSHELFIWQSLFMWVPVISCTFASIARQFKNIGSQDLGWLFIDEAGQATPQAAVGAIWRAKNVLVVGDPLQIEPVFTTPPNLIEGIAKDFFASHQYEQWLPNFSSVQILADKANVRGAYLATTEETKWIGSPLRVHRRCLSPMFDVANKIAYESKMINVRAPGISDKQYFNQSCWYDVVGEVTDKQYIPEQGEALLCILADVFSKERKLPKIYIITPFKRIKFNLLKLVGNPTNWQKYLHPNIKLPPMTELRQWCRTHIGTVHTFQGKEAPAVIFVLGVNDKHQGAANWASGKPNLLNVALTRAKNEIIIIGDYKLWSKKSYFSTLANNLVVDELYPCSMEIHFL